MLGGGGGGRRTSARSAAPSPRHKKMVPNTYVPATDKRRDDLRWQVRAGMAWSH